MDLHLTPDPHDRGPFRLFVHGTLVAEYSVGLTQNRDSLLAEVTQARALQGLKRIIQAWGRALTVRQARHAMQVTRTPREIVEYAQGLEDGRLGGTSPYVDPGVPPLPLEHTSSYRKGYEDGQVLRRCLAVIEAAAVEPSQAAHAPTAQLALLTETAPTQATLF